ncbi:MAG: hypothetical protein GX606_00095, partial [Elusimicrobia bacterium]|nr:hypothetical protein [Elusimicrobiota bacterium]
PGLLPSLFDAIYAYALLVRWMTDRGDWEEDPATASVLDDILVRAADEYPGARDSLLLVEYFIRREDEEFLARFANFRDTGSPYLFVGVLAMALTLMVRRGGSAVEIPERIFAYTGEEWMRRGLALEFSAALVFVSPDVFETFEKTVLAEFLREEIPQDRRDFWLAFLMARRSEKFREILLDRLTGALADGQISGTVFENIIGLLANFVSPATLLRLREIDTRLVPDVRWGRLLEGLIAEMASVVGREPAVVIRDMEDMIGQGRYEDAALYAERFLRIDTAERRVRLAGDRSFREGLEEVRRIGGKARLVVQAQKAAEQALRSSDFSGALLQVHEALGLLPDNADLIRSLGICQRLIAIEKMYQGEELAPALEQIHGLPDQTGAWKAAVEALRSRIEAYAAICRAAARNPDHAREEIRSLVKKFSRDPRFREKERALEAVIRSRKETLRRVSTLLSAGQIDPARKTLFEAAALGCESLEFHKAALAALETLRGAGHPEEALRWCGDLIALGSKRSADFEKARAAFWGEVQMGRLAPLYHMIWTLWKVLDHRSVRIRNSFGSEYVYSSLELSSDALNDAFRVNGLRRRNGIPTENGHQDRQKMAPRDIARTGESFVFMAPDGKRATDDYFTVESVDERGIVFAFDSPEQKASAAPKLP